MTDIVERLRTSAKDWELEGEMSGGECVYAFDKLSAELEEAAKEIERLRGVEQDAAEWVEERTKRLRAEVERLRAALREIVEYGNRYGIRDEGDGHALVGIARAALERKDG